MAINQVDLFGKYSWTDHKRLVPRFPDLYSDVLYQEEKMASCSCPQSDTKYSGLKHDTSESCNLKYVGGNFITLSDY